MTASRELTEKASQHPRFFTGFQEPVNRWSVLGWGGYQVAVLQFKQWEAVKAVFLMKQKCCRSNLQLGQHLIDGADDTTDGAKLQNYRINCC